MVALDLPRDDAGAGRKLLNRLGAMSAYMREACHVHAIASVRLHGGGFAIAYDESEVYHEEGETVIHGVVHVWSVHETADGLIARDATGDVPATPERMRATLKEWFPDLWQQFADGDIRIDDRATLVEVLALSGDGEEHPLFTPDEEGLAEAARLPGIVALPGTNPAPNPEDDPVFTLL